MRRSISLTAGSVVVGLLALLGVGPSQAALVARYLDGSSSVNAYYDSTANLTWLKNTIMGTGELYLVGSVPGVNENTGKMTLSGARLYVDVLNSISYLGFNDWRMPQGDFRDATCSDLSNNLRLGTGCQENELVSLFENNADAMSLFDNVRQENAQGFRDVGYWSSNAYASSYSMAFNADGPGRHRAAITAAPWVRGGERASQFVTQAWVEDGSLWLMREGDMAAPVQPGGSSTIPEPATLSLVGLAVIGLATFTGRRPRAAALR